jgi:propionate CoA-transferase
MAAKLPLYCGKQLDEQDIRFFVEQGAIGGISLPGSLFGTAYMPEALMEMPSWFDYLDGGAFTAAFLGFGETDGSGSVNNHRIGGMLPGCGGFIDITTRAPRIVFCGTFTAGGLRVAWDQGKLVVEQEGRNAKFVKQIGAPTLSAAKCLAKGQRVTWITERAVLELAPSGLVVTEIAPGISRKDLQGAAGCELRFADDLAEMDPALFTEEEEGYKVRVNE